VNMSLGGPGTPDDPVSIAVENGVSAGVVFAIAAGNTGGAFTVSAPANAPSAIAVGASDITDHVAFFSSSGPSGSNQAIKPEVVAPGVNILSAAPGGGTAVHSGTSMASPHVAGVAALLKAIHPAWTPQQIKSAIVSTAQFLNLDVMQQGGGCVDALRAANAQLLPSPATIAFGRVDTSGDTWTTTATVGLTNISSSALTLTATATGTRDGVDVTISPSQFTVQPNDAQTVTITATVTNSALPYPTNGSLDVGGQIVFSGASPVHVPWALVKAARIRAHYADGDQVSMTVAGFGSTPTVRDVDSRPGEGTLETFVAPGKYIVQLVATPVSSPTRIMFAPSTDVSGDVTLEFSRATASYAIDDSATDASGRLLSQIGMKPGSCDDSALLRYPPGTPLSFTEIGSVTDRGTAFRFYVSALPDGVTIGGDQICTDGLASVYVAQFPSIVPNSDVTRSVDAASWKSVPLKIRVPDSVSNPVVQFGSTLFANAGVTSIGIPEVNEFPVSGSAWSGTLFITPEESGNTFRAGALQLSDGLVTAIASPGIRNRNGAIVLSSDAVPRPDAYTAKPGEALSFGEGLLHPEAVSFGSLVQTAWVGALDEQLPYLNQSATLDVHDTSFDLSAGPARLTATFDPTKSDAVPPVLRSFRVVDRDGVVTSVVPANTPATLRFAAIDGAFTGLVAEPKTSVSWKPHGAIEWLPLAAIVEAEDIGSYGTLGHLPAGSVFSADLSSVTQRAAGDVDLRVHVEDAAGNAIDYTLSPAIAVSANGRRRAVH
ncbi:MAG TPA: S8 family serine peptidase, partial [Thermoanaerobaculia bacterium]|nr:S8 family serine peptidase [Thermoanaerobaculia bacterium]